MVDVGRGAETEEKVGLPKRRAAKGVQARRTVPKCRVYERTGGGSSCGYFGDSQGPNAVKLRDAEIPVIVFTAPPSATFT